MNELNIAEPYQFLSTSHDFLRGNQQAYKRKVHFKCLYKNKVFFSKLFDGTKHPKFLKNLLLPQNRSKQEEKKLLFFSLLHFLFENLYFIYFCSFYVAKLNLFLDLLHTKSGFMKHFTHFNLLYSA